MHSDPTFWAAYANLEREKRQRPQQPRPRVTYSAGAIRQLKRERIKALVRDALAGKSKQQRQRL